MWQLRSPPRQVGGVWSHGMHGNIGALLHREVGSRAMGRVVVLEPSHAGR
jgi:hypothetical protein